MSCQKKRFAIILSLTLKFSLGTHTLPFRLRRFLKEFLWDPRVVNLPRPLWWMILHFIVLPFRPSLVAEASQYPRFGSVSPNQLSYFMEFDATERFVVPFLRSSFLLVLLAGILPWSRITRTALHLLLRGRHVRAPKEFRLDSRSVCPKRCGTCQQTNRGAPQRLL